MKKIICITLALCVLLFCFTGCVKQPSEKDFRQYAQNCHAASFYTACLDYAETEKITYLFNKRTRLVYVTETLCCACEYTEENFKKARAGVTNDTDSLVDVPGYDINGEKYTVSVLSNKRPLYGSQKDFGLVAVSEESPKIIYFWYFDMDNNERISTEEKFNKFFPKNFRSILKELKKQSKRSEQ